MGISIDEREAPLVRVDYDGPLLMSDHDQLMTTISGYFECGQRFALVFASRPDGRGDRGTAKAQLEWLDRERDRLGRYVAGWALVVDEAEAEALAKGKGARIRSMMPFPQEHFTDLDQATAWAKAQLAADRSGS